MSRKQERLKRLRAKLKKQHSSLADDFEYRMFYVMYNKDKSQPPLMHEAEKVGLSMTNNQEKAIMEGVRANAYSPEEATSLLLKDTVQIHAARWFSLSKHTIGVVENIDFLVWPRRELDRIEVLCFSRWKTDDPAYAEPYQLMSQRFTMYQASDLTTNIIPLLVRCIKHNDRKGGIMFNDGQSLGIWVTPKNANADLNMRMTSMMLCFPQENLTRWELDCALGDETSEDVIFEILEKSGRNISADKNPMRMPDPDMPRIKDESGGGSPESEQQLQLEQQEEQEQEEEEDKEGVGETGAVAAADNDNKDAGAGTMVVCAKDNEHERRARNTAAYEQARKKLTASVEAEAQREAQRRRDEAAQSWLVDTTKPKGPGKGGKSGKKGRKSGKKGKKGKGSKRSGGGGTAQALASSLNNMSVAASKSKDGKGEGLGLADSLGSSYLRGSLSKPNRGL